MIVVAEFRGVSVVDGTDEEVPDVGELAARLGCFREDVCELFCGWAEADSECFVIKVLSEVELVSEYVA